MAVVRELTTVLDFKTETGGLKVYQEAIEKTRDKVKDIALDLGKAFGLFKAFQIVTNIGDFVEGIMDAGKEIATVNKQINLAKRDFDDMAGIQEGILQTANKIGVSYTAVADVFKDMLINSREAKTSQEDLIGLTENLYKGFKLGGATAEQMQMGLSVINRSMRRGTFSKMALGTLEDMGGWKLVEILKKDYPAAVEKGKITTEQFMKAFSKQNKELNAEYSKLGIPLTNAIQRIKNTLSVAAAELWKTTKGFSFLGTIIWQAFSKAWDAVKKLIDALGGLQSVLELVGIAFALILGPTVITAAITLLDTIVAMVSASAALVAPWLAIGAAITAATLLIQDFMVWMRGDKVKTVTGSWLGPYKDLKEKLDKGMNLGDLIKIPDHEGWNALATAIGNTYTELKQLDDYLKKAGLPGSMGDIVANTQQEIEGLQGVWDKVRTKFAEFLADRKDFSAQDAADIAKLKQYWEDFKNKVVEVSSAFATSVVAKFNEVKEVITKVTTALSKEIPDAINTVIGFFSQLGEKITSVFGGAIDWIDKTIGKIREMLGIGKAKEQFGPPAPTGTGEAPAPGAMYGPPAPPTKGWSGITDWIKSSTLPQVPGAPEPKVQTITTTNNMQPSLTVSPNITVTAEMNEAQVAAAVSKQVEATSSSMLDRVSRQIRDAAPRSELPIQ